MHRGRARCRILDAQVVVVVAAVEKVVQLPLGTAIGETRAEGVVGAAIDRRRAPLIKAPALRLDVHHARRAQPVFRGQRPGDEPQALHEARIQFLAETRDAFRQHDVIDAVLQVRVFPAHMDLAQRIRRHARGAQQQLIEPAVLPRRQRLQLLLIDRVSARAEIQRNLGADLFNATHDRDGLQTRGVREAAGAGRGYRWCRGHGRGRRIGLGTGGRGAQEHHGRDHGLIFAAPGAGPERTTVHRRSGQNRGNGTVEKLGIHITHWLATRAERATGSGRIRFGRAGSGWGRD